MDKENLEISVERDNNGRKTYVCWLNRGSTFQQKLVSRNLPNLLSQLSDCLKEKFDLIDDLGIGHSW